MLPRNAQMMTLKEHCELSEAIQSMDAQFTDDVIDNAEFYDIEEDPITLQTTVTIYDVNGGVLLSTTVEDYDVAIGYLENVFDLEFFDAEDSDDDAAAGNSRFGHA